MAKVLFSSFATRRKGYVMTTRDLCWTLSPDGEPVFVPNGKRGRPAKVRAVCVRWTCGQAFTYSWNPALKREATEGMKRSQNQMKEAVAKAKMIWADPIQKEAWTNQHKRQPGRYKTAWMMLVASCLNVPQSTVRKSLIDKAISRPNTPVSKPTSHPYTQISKAPHDTLETYFYRYMEPRAIVSGAYRSRRFMREKANKRRPSPPQTQGKNQPLSEMGEQKQLNFAHFR